MEKLQFDKVDILLVDPDRNARDSVKVILHNAGFRDLAFGLGIADITEHFKTEMPDLIISEAEPNDGDFCEFITRVRHHRIGHNPFVPIIALTWTPRPDLVRRVIGAGADDLLVKPLSAAQLLDRIRLLVKARKPFVVTSEYIGPDRRHEHERQASPEIRRMDVPNTLRAKATGTRDLAAIQNDIDAAIHQVNETKMERHADQIHYIVDRIAPPLEAGEMSTALAGFLERLLFTAEDTSRRLVGTRYAHVSALCQSLIKVTRSIQGSGGRPNPKDAKLLRPLSQAIHAAFHADEAAAAAAREISETVAGGRQ